MGDNVSERLVVKAPVSLSVGACFFASGHTVYFFVKWIKLIKAS